jgi:hypothetical protein
MKTFALAFVVLVVPGWSGARALDKTGTTSSRFEAVIPKSRENMEPANAGSMDTERAGFEPAVEFPPHSISSAAQSTTLSPLRRRES